MDPRSPLPVDSRAARRFVDRRIARGLPLADPLAREVETRLDERLAIVRLSPTRILDAGSGVAPARDVMRRRYPGVELVELDQSVRALAGTRRSAGAGLWLRRLAGIDRDRRVCADLAALPFADAQFDLVWSNLALGATHQPEVVFAEWQRVLRVGGLVFFSAYGPDTLVEWRNAWHAAGEPERVHRFIDMHDLGDMLSRAGFAAPVMEMERITLTYAGFEAMLAELRAMAAPGALASRPRGLIGRSRFEAVRQAYSRACQDGRWPITFEIVYGHAWKPESRTRNADRTVMQFVRTTKRS